MEISLNIFLFFWMEKNLILLSHIYSIEYLGLVVLLWPLWSNGNTCSTKNCPFWSSSYLAMFFLPLSIFFSLLCILLHGSKLHREVQPCNCKYGKVQMLLNRAARFMTRLNLAIENIARFKCSLTVQRGSWQRFNLAIKNMARFKYVQDGLFKIQK